jgi:hypothetical protein
MANDSSTKSDDVNDIAIAILSNIISNSDTHLPDKHIIRIEQYSTRCIEAMGSIYSKTIKLVTKYLDEEKFGTCHS